MTPQKTPRHWLISLLRTRTLAAALVLAALVSIIATYISITRRAGFIAPDARSTVVLLLINLMLLLLLVAIVTRRGVRLWASLKIGSVGSRLQTRIVAMFTLVTIAPTLIVSVFSVMLFNYGIQSWFDERVSTAIGQSVDAAQAYLAEHKDNIRADAIAMASDLDRELGNDILPPARFNTLVNDQAALRSLTEAVVFQHGRILAQTRLAFSLAFERLPVDDIEMVEHGEVVVKLEGGDKLRALVKLSSLPETYLLIGRFVDAKVIAYMDTANGGVEQYHRAKENLSSTQIQYSIIFLVLSLVLLLFAIWYGMLFASRLIVPITKLVNAAERVRAGDFAVQVDEGPKDDEIGTLARAFNRMTGELKKQRQDLVEANRQLDGRRRFTEAVLSGVSAGIVALSRDKHVTLANPVAASLLYLPQDIAQSGLIITEIVPELTALFEQADSKSGTVLVQEDITVMRNEKSHVLHVRVAVERILDSVEGYILTFDDITDLLVAQRSAAWSDVARRVAHEIKNPLTPIQLAAERLRKKFMPQNPVDAENYSRYVDIIAKHVVDIGAIVEEFVTFARMPAPVMRQEDMPALIRKAVFSEQTAHPDVSYRMQLEEGLIPVYCDERQISRALLNLLKNAAEAFENREHVKGLITVQCFREGEDCKIRIMDNGPGFPPDMLHRLLEPYVTTRAKGSGLGLAIVKKIIDDHKAHLTLENLPEGGTCVTLIFPVDAE